MKSEKGITLIALIMYVILMTFIVAGVSTITTSFYSNINDVDTTSESAVSLSRFNMYFINDIKEEGVRIVSSSQNRLDLTINNKEGKTEPITYSVQNGILYRNKVKICEKVKDINIQVDKNTGIVTIYLKINNYEKTTTYILEPKEKDNNSVTVT